MIDFSELYHVEVLEIKYFLFVILDFGILKSYTLFKRFEMEELLLKRLVTYFSATGITAKVASSLADAIDADIFEIRPSVLYSAADLDWKDKNSRSTLEMNDPASRPQISHIRNNLQDYDVIFVGFPIWWYVAPRIINTFLESYNFTGKTIVPFATSGGSGVEKVNESIQGSCPDANLREASLLSADAGLSDLSAWAETLGL